MEAAIYLLSFKWVVYTTLVIIAAVTDHRARRIPNWLTYSCAIAGIAFAISGVMAGFAHSVSGLEAWWPLLNSLIGGLFGFAVMFFLFLRNGVGGGDVKLNAAAGLLVGITHIVAVMMYACFVGVAIGLGTAIWHGRGMEVLRRMFSWKELREKRSPEESMQPVPYGVAFAGGALWAALMPVLV